MTSPCCVESYPPCYSSPFQTPASSTLVMIAQSRATKEPEKKILDELDDQKSIRSLSIPLEPKFMIPDLCDNESDDEELDSNDGSDDCSVEEELIKIHSRGYPFLRPRGTQAKGVSSLLQCRPRSNYQEEGSISTFSPSRTMITIPPAFTRNEKVSSITDCNISSSFLPRFSSFPIREESSKQTKRTKINEAFISSM